MSSELPQYPFFFFICANWQLAFVLSWITASAHLYRIRSGLAYMNMCQGLISSMRLSSETTKYTYDRKSILLSGTKAPALEAQELSANCYAPNIKNQ